MNELSNNLPTQIPGSLSGLDQKPTIETDVELLNTGPEQNQADHQIVVSPETQAAEKGIEEVKAMVQDTPQTDKDSVQVELAQVLEPIQPAHKEATEEVKKKGSLNLKSLLIASASAALVSGVGLLGMGGFGKKAEKANMPLPEGPKVEQSNTHVDKVVNNDPNSIGYGSSTTNLSSSSLFTAPVQAAAQPAPKAEAVSRMSGANMPDVPPPTFNSTVGDGEEQINLAARDRANAEMQSNESVQQRNTDRAGARRGGVLQMGNVIAANQEAALESIAQVQTLLGQEMDNLTVQDGNTGNSKNLTELKGAVLSQDGKVYFRFDRDTQVTQVDNNNRITGFRNSTISERKNSVFVTIEQNGSRKVIEGSSLPDSGVINIQGDGNTIVRLQSRSANGDTIFNGSMRM